MLPSRAHRPELVRLHADAILAKGLKSLVSLHHASCTANSA